MKEKEIQRQILDYLACKRIFHYKANNVGIYRKDTGSYIPSGVLGLPDIICCVAGQFVGIEVKREKGIQSDHQKAFQASLEQAGGRYVLARSVDDIINII